MSTLTETEREALVKYVEDAIIFGMGAWSEAQTSFRKEFGSADLAREFIAARYPVEIEDIIDGRVGGVTP